MKWRRDIPDGTESDELSIVGTLQIKGTANGVGVFRKRGQSTVFFNGRLPKSNDAH
jgi:hypothetical protein